MKLWVLYDVGEDGAIIGIDAVTSEESIAELWKRETDLYRAQQFDTDNAAEHVSDIFAMNFECSREQQQ